MREENLGHGSTGMQSDEPLNLDSWNEYENLNSSWKEMMNEPPRERPNEMENWGWTPQYQWGWTAPEDKENKGDENRGWTLPQNRVWNTPSESSTGMWSASVFGTYEAFTAGEWTTSMFPGMENISSFSTPQAVHTTSFSTSQEAGHTTCLNTPPQVEHTISLGCIEDSIAMPTLSRLNFREVRRRVLSTHLQSPFYLNTKTQEDFAKFIKSKAESNVGLRFVVGYPFFENMMKKQSELTDAHINTYLALLYANPRYAGIRFVRPGIVLTNTEFMEGLRGVWKNYHSLEIITKFDYNTEEVISEEDLHGLSEYVSGNLPG